MHCDQEPPPRPSPAGNSGGSTDPVGWLRLAVGVVLVLTFAFLVLQDVLNPSEARADRQIGDDFAGPRQAASGSPRLSSLPKPARLDAAGTDAGPLGRRPELSRSYWNREGGDTAGHYQRPADSSGEVG